MQATPNFTPSAVNSKTHPAEQLNINLWGENYALRSTHYAQGGVEPCVSLRYRIGLTASTKP